MPGPVFLLLSAVTLALQGTDTLTLPGAMRHAEQHRGTLLAAVASAAQGRAASRTVTLIPNPSLQFEHDQSSPTNKATLHQRLDWLLQRGAANEAGRALTLRGTVDSVVMRVALGRDVRIAFYASLAADRLLELAEEHADLADSVRRLADRRLEAGAISELDRSQARQEAGRAALARSRARESARVARVELARQIGWDPGDPPHAVGQLVDDLYPASDLAAPAPPVDALPEVRRAEADSAEAAARLRLANLSRLPIPGIIVGREWGPAWSTAAGTIVGFSMPLPLWSQGGERTATAHAQLALAIAAAREARGAADARLMQAGARLTEAAWRARYAMDSLRPAASRLRAGAVRLFEEGDTGLLAVFEAMRAERAIAEEAIAELQAFQEALAEWRAAKGEWE
jgi:cobalt-zinc-cadmium efflux system outer membrane protein